MLKAFAFGVKVGKFRNLPDPYGIVCCEVLKVKASTPGNIKSLTYRSTLEILEGASGREKVGER